MKYGPEELRPPRRASENDWSECTGGPLYLQNFYQYIWTMPQDASGNTFGSTIKLNVGCDSASSGDCSFSIWTADGWLSSESGLEKQAEVNLSRMAVGYPEQGISASVSFGETLDPGGPVYLQPTVNSLEARPAPSE